jgi:hypothetical protein
MDDPLLRAAERASLKVCAPDRPSAYRVYCICTCPARTISRISQPVQVAGALTQLATRRRACCDAILACTLECPMQSERTPIIKS